MIVTMAAELGLDAIALTDHDTLAGMPEAKAAADKMGLGLIPGVELSVNHRGTKIHMLVYGIEPGTGPIQDKLEHLRSGRTARNHKIVAALVDLGYEITMDDVLRHAHGPSVGRPHIADALVEGGYIASRDEAFADLLHDGGVAYFPRIHLSAIEAIELATESGGVSVIAHPKTVNLRSDPFVEMLKELASKGLGGIEAHHPMHDADLRHHLEGLAHQLGLIATGGSDYHGMTQRTFRIGTGTGDLRIPPEAFDQISSLIRR